MQSSASSEFKHCHPRLTREVGNLATGVGLEQAFLKAADATACGPLAAVVNCAAISFPGQCETHPTETSGVNVPTKLVESLCQHAQRTGWVPLLVQLSTDQVYGDSRCDGKHSSWRESDAIAPVNVYGAQKAEAEAMIEARYPHHVILRSSVMYGPLPQLLGPVKGERFLQFCSSVLDGKKDVKFFDDEWRNFVSVEDVAAAVAASVRLWPPVKLSSKEAIIAGDGYIRSVSESIRNVVSVDARAGSYEGAAASWMTGSRSEKGVHHSRRAINVAGPERMSRADFALALARARGLPQDSVKTESVTVGGNSRPMTSPSDSSVDVTKMREVLGVEPRSVEDVLQGLYGKGHMRGEERRISFFILRGHLRVS